MSIVDLLHSKKPEFEHLLEQHLSGLYRVALHYTRHQAKAEDLVQDTVVRALRFRDKFTLGTNFKAWIYTILTHTFIHRYRREKLERQALTGVFKDDVLEQMGSLPNPVFTTAWVDNLLCDDASKALEDLPEEFRMVVVLCDIEGLSYKEISEALDCPVGTVMSRLYRGRRILEKRLYHLAVERGIVKTKAVEEVVELEHFRRRKLG